MGQVQVSTKCGLCGKSILSSMPACPSCGAVQKYDPRPGPHGHAVSWVDSYPIDIKECAECGSTRIRRLSRIAHSLRRFGPDLQLARELAPPRRPHMDSRTLIWIPLGVGGAIGVLWFIAAVWVSAAYLAPGKNDALPGWDIFVCAMVALAGFTTGFFSVQKIAAKKVAKLELEEGSELERWSREMEAWERLYYCGDCQKVFDPLAGRSTSAKAMGRLLFK